MVDPSDEWQQALARSVGRQVKHYRTLRRLTAQQVSDDLRTRFGIDMKRTVLGNLESGYRRVVNYAEIVALAHLLDVPPLALIVPVGEPGFEVLPGVTVHPWSAARWITGEGGPPGSDDERPASLADPSVRGTLALYRLHDEAVEHLRRAVAVFEALSPEALQTEAFASSFKSITDAVDGLRAVQEEMRRREVAPPETGLADRLDKLVQDVRGGNLPDA